MRYSAHHLSFINTDRHLLLHSSTTQGPQTKAEGQTEARQANTIEREAGESSVRMTSQFSPS